MSVHNLKMRPWVAVALFVAAVILGIYGYQAFRYWDSWQGSGSLTTRTDTLNAILSRDEPPLGEISGRLDSDWQRLDRLKQEFEYPSVDSMISTLSNAASSAGLGLASVTVSDPGIDEIDGIRYRIQPITVTALGSLQGIFDFLDSLNEPAPSAVVSSVQLSGVDSDPVAKLGFQFYLSPQLISENEPEDESAK